MKLLRGIAVAREREIMGQTEIARVSRLATMGAMVASIAHEIRQPLAAVVANSHAGTRWLEKDEPNLNEARAALKSIGEDGHRANEVISSISAMFKKNANKRVPVDINGLVSDVLNLSRGELRSRKIALSTNLAADLPRISANPVQFREVLLNLIMNGAEAMSTTAENLRALAVGSRLETSEVTITVEDSGAGIDATNADQIFEAFFTTKPTGMGMGLAICRSIIAAHNGRLWASPGRVLRHCVLCCLATRCGRNAHGRHKKYGLLCELAHRRLVRWKQTYGCRGLSAWKMRRSDETGKSLRCYWSLRLRGRVSAARISQRVGERGGASRPGMPGRYETGIRQCQKAEAAANPVQHVCAHRRNRAASLLVLPRVGLRQRL